MRIFILLTSLIVATVANAQVIVWSWDPTEGPNFNSANSGLQITGDGEITVPDPSGGWGSAFAPWRPLTSPLTSTNLEDYTVTVNVNATLQNNGVGPSINFRDASGNNLGRYRYQWPTLFPGENSLVFTVAEMTVQGGDPLDPAEVPLVTQIEFFMGGLQTAGAVFQFGEQSISVIPEPRIYAALAGALTLGFIFWRRRK